MGYDDLWHAGDGGGCGGSCAPMMNHALHAGEEANMG